MANITVENIVILLFFGALILSSVCLCYKRYIYVDDAIQASGPDMVEVVASPYAESTIESPMDSDGTVSARVVSSKSEDLDYTPKATETNPPKVLVAESVLFYEWTIFTTVPKCQLFSIL